MVTSNGELLVVLNIVRNGSLWIDEACEKEVISYSNYKRLQARSLLSIWKHTNLSNNGVFSFTILLQLRWPTVESKFPKICYLMQTGSHQVKILVFDNYIVPNVSIACKYLVNMYLSFPEPRLQWKIFFNLHLPGLLAEVAKVFVAPLAELVVVLLGLLAVWTDLPHSSWYILPWLHRQRSSVLVPSWSRGYTDEWLASWLVVYGTKH